MEQDREVPQDPAPGLWLRRLSILVGDELAADSALSPAAAHERVAPLVLAEFSGLFPEQEPDMRARFFPVAVPAEVAR